MDVNLIYKVLIIPLALSRETVIIDYLEFSGEGRITEVARNGRLTSFLFILFWFLFDCISNNLFFLMFVKINIIVVENHNSDDNVDGSDNDGYNDDKEE